ncbi:MAG: Rad52/Rad22 family DNA repair protein [Chloroflexota bacterium]
MEPDDNKPIISGEIVAITPRALDQPDERHQLLLQTLSEAQVDFLLQRTPAHEIKLRQGRGGMQFSYVEHGYVTERLNLVFGFNWDFEVVDKQILEDEVIVEAKLTVRTPGGQTILKTQFGGADIKRHTSGARSGKPLSIADDYKAAASDALKKCASLLGIGLDLYGRDRPYETDDAAQQTGGPRSTGNQSRGKERAVPHAGGIGPVVMRDDVNVGLELAHIDGGPTGLCTQAQWREISKAAIAAGMSVPELCSSLNVQTLAELTEARAERVITRLNELAGEREARKSS